MGTERLAVHKFDSRWDQNEMYLILSIHESYPRLCIVMLTLMRHHYCTYYVNHFRPPQDNTEELDL